jgi:hypothetical protein
VTSKFEKYRSLNSESTSTYTDHQKSIKAFYNAVTKNWNQKVPSFCHMKIQKFPTESTCSDPNRLQLQPFYIDSREYMGPDFVEHILGEMEDYETEKSLEKNLDYRKDHGSLLGFMWGARLAKFIKEIENTDTLYATDKQKKELKSNLDIKGLRAEDFVGWEAGKWQGVLRE